MTEFARCPVCHHRMKLADQLKADQAALAGRRREENAGATFIGYDSPADDTRAFPCRICQTPIVRGELVQGQYNEAIPRPLFVEVPGIAVGAGYLYGWVLQWGPLAGVGIAVLATAIGAFLLFHFHHDLLQYSKRSKLERISEYDLPNLKAVWSPVLMLLVWAIVAPVAATLLYGWGGVLGVAGGLVIALVLTVIVASASAGKPRRRSSMDISEQNRRELDRAKGLTGN